MNYRVKKTDANQLEIMKALRNCGYCVASLHTVGGGLPDLIVGTGGTNVLMEIKMPGKKLNDKEKEFFDKWCGPIVVADSVESAVEIMGHFR